jgi:hypothetical protein
LEDFCKGGTFGARDRRYGNVDFASLLNDNDWSRGLSKEEGRKKKEESGEQMVHLKRQQHGDEISRKFGF